MKSFGMWYQEKSKETKSSNSVEYEKLPVEKSEQEKLDETSVEVDQKKVGENEDNSPQFSLHVNFWSLEDAKLKSTKASRTIKTPILDIGIKIKNYDKIKTLTFFCPFKLDGELIDLSQKLENKNNASIIFNSDCEIETLDCYTIVKIPENEEKLLIFPMDQVIKNVYSTEDVPEKDPTASQIIFDFETFHRYVDETDKLKALKLDTIYIRFRIENASLKKHIYSDSEPINKSFESAFSGTRIIDFKVNEKRNIDDSIRVENAVNKQKWVNFKDIHYLIMAPSSYDMTSFYKGTMTCRELEDELWDDYLGVSVDIPNSHVLAYHWKSQGARESFACLVKVNYSRAKKSTIILYMLSVIVLGIISNMIVNTWTEFFKPLAWQYYVGGLVAIAIWLLSIRFLSKKSK